jgi:hypothetical protein
MNDFICPKCQGHLRVGDHIIFKVRNKKKQHALLLLSAQIGNYSSEKHPEFFIEPGELLDFFCPLCNATMQSDIHQHLARVLMKDDQGDYFEVYFSEVSGEHITYTTSGDKLHIEGEHAGRYTYFKVGEKFKKYF